LYFKRKKEKVFTRPKFEPGTSGSVSTHDNHKTKLPVTEETIDGVTYRLPSASEREWTTPSFHVGSL